MYLTQYDAHGVENVDCLDGLLGLRNLTFVQRMKEAALNKYGVDIDKYRIVERDKETLRLFGGVIPRVFFQFEQAERLSL